MATPRVTAIKGSLLESQEGYNKIKVEKYEMGPYGTLALADLELGDSLPSDSDYEIISSTMEFVDRRRIATVKAVDEVTEATSTSTSWDELRGTKRLVANTVEYQEWEVRFTAATASTAPAVGSNIQAACDGSSLFGSSNVDGSFDLDEEPEAIAVQVIKKVTPTKDHCVVRYRAYYEEIAAASASYWDELRGTRRLTRETPYDREWEIRFSAATGTSLPVNGETLANVTGDATDLLASADPTDDGLAREPVIISAVYIKRPLLNKDHIVVRFRASKTRGANAVVS